MGQAQAIPAQRLYRTTLLTKAAMAVTGIMLLGFVLGHMLGNLQVFDVFGGRAALNGYAEGLRKFPTLLWIARIGLIVAVIIHIASSWKLTMLNQSARPTRYAVLKPKRSTFASRSMRWTGPIVLLYIIYHLLHFTFLAFNGDYVHLQPYDNVIKGFSSVPVALVYIVANSALAVHLWHGVWALFQSLGMSHAKYDPYRRAFATGFTGLITVGFLSVPLAVLFGIVG
jgi:succinate dehydrogenase / fumarate reductase cytochrome b subunit